MYTKLPPDLLDRLQERLEPPEEPRHVPWGKIALAVVLLIGLACLLYPLWKYRLPQEHDFTDSQGNRLHVRIEGRNDLLLQYTVPGSSNAHYLAIASLSPADQAFVGHLSSKLQLGLPLNSPLGDASGAETPVQITAHNSDWVQYSLLTDGTSHFFSLASLPAADQLLVRSLPAYLYLSYPLDYSFAGAQPPGAGVRLIGRNETTVKYISLAEGKTFSALISALPKIDQAFVRALPINLSFEAPASDSAPAPVSNPTPAPVAAATPPTPNLRSDQPISSDQIKSLVFIEGDRSSGSGFIVKLYGQFFVVTNLSVLSGNKQFTLTGYNGARFPATTQFYAAINYDVALIKISESQAKFYLEVLPDISANARPNTPVSVPGNAHGARVPVQMDGNLLGIGPEVIEVDAQFVDGHAGSPIIDRASGKVLGVATYTRTYDKDQLQRNVLSTSTRWFGYRLDNLDLKTGWQLVDWSSFSLEGLNLLQVQDVFRNVLSLFANQNPATIANVAIHNAFLEYQTQTGPTWGNQNRSANALITAGPGSPVVTNRLFYAKQAHDEAVKTLNTKLRALVDRTIGVLNHPISNYHARLVTQEKDVQAYLDLLFKDPTQELFSFEQWRNP